MNLGRHLAAVIALLLVAQADPGMIGRDAPRPSGTPPSKGLSESLVQRPVVFEPNVGQFEQGVRYRATASGMSLSLTDAAAVLSLGTEHRSQRQIRITPVSASRDARPRALDRLTGVVNRFEGVAASEWHAGVPTYARVSYPAVYPGIDLVYHGSPAQLEYDFVVDRGADPSRIAVRFDGAERVEIDAAGDLLIHAGPAVVRQHAPFVWQAHGHERRRVDAAYRLTTAGDVAFAIGSYDRRLPLVIDPILLYSSYLNAQTSHVAIDAAGLIVIVTERLTQGPTPLGIKVERLTPDGQTTIYTTLIGAEYMPVDGVAVTPEGEAVVAATTASTNFPLVNAAQGHPGDTSLNAVVFKLSASGNFVFSTYLGGMSTDAAFSVKVNDSGTIVVGGLTSSQDFPGVDGVRVAAPDGFVTVFSPNGSRLHGSLLPSTIFAVDVDAAGRVYVAGDTPRRDWPTTPGAFQTAPHIATCGDYSFGPCRQGVLAELSADLGTLMYSTYLHPTGQQTSDAEVQVRALEVDASGAAYVLGSTSNGSFAATPGALQQECASSTSWCSFLAKLNPAGSARLYSTFLPFNPEALQVDARGNAYLAGGYGGVPTPNALQAKPADAQLFVTADGGTTWRATPPPQPAHGLAIAHGTGPILYSSNYDKGLFRSTDLGDHWAQIDKQVLGTLFIAPSNPDVFYEPTGRLVRRSTDGGATWAVVPSPVETRAFAVDPIDAQALYAGGDGLFKSVNGGYTWSSASAGIAAGVTIASIVAAPSNHNLLFAQVSTPYPTESVGLYRTVNGGATWTLMSSWPSYSFGRVAIDPLDATRLYVCADGKPWRSTNSGASWTLFANSYCLVIAVTRTPDLTVFVASGDGLARVVDTGGTLPTPLSLSLGNGGVYQLAVDPVDPRVMVAVTFSTRDGFVSVLDSTGTRLRYGSFFGGADADSFGAMALGAGGTLALSGWTQSRDLPLANPRIPERHADRSDSFVALMRIPLPAVVIDAPTAGSIGRVFNVSGWAIDSGAPAGAGIDAVHVWAIPQDGGAPAFVGVASYGAARSDVGSAYGAQFTNSGFSLTGGRLPPGPYTLAVFARSTVSGTYDSAIRSVQVIAEGRMSVDIPGPGASLPQQPFTIAGWAFDAAAPTGTGVDAVHVWAYPDGGTPRFVGAATYGVERPDVGAAFGSRFAATGFTLQASGLSPGDYTLAVIGRSLVTGAFDLVRTVRVTLPDGGAAAIDTPVAGAAVSTPFVVSGWALDRQGAGTGVDALHIWAFPGGGGAPTFLGAADSMSRPDVAAAFGDPRFEPSGYALTVNTLPRGTYTLVVYARSVVTGAFSIVRSVQVFVN